MIHLIVFLSGYLSKDMLPNTSLSECTFPWVSLKTCRLKIRILVAVKLGYP